jgi:hypothetical protein
MQINSTLINARRCDNGKPLKHINVVIQSLKALLASVISAGLIGRQIMAEPQNPCSGAGDGLQCRSVQSALGWEELK